jgi:hypothetical protein
MILRLTLTTAELVGESAAEWQVLEQMVRLGEWTSGPRKDEWRLRYLAARFKIPLRVEGIAGRRSRRRSRSGPS